MLTPTNGGRVGQNTEGSAARLGLSEGAQGVLPSQALERAVALGMIDAGDFKVPASSIQPASVDLRLGEVAYRIRCSFLPDRRPVELKLKEFVVDELDLRRDGAVLETNRPYLIPLIEQLQLPADMRGKANPKSSTGRLDVFTRVITDEGFRFDEIPGWLPRSAVPGGRAAVVHRAREAGPRAQPAPAVDRRLASVGRGHPRAARAGADGLCGRRAGAGVRPGDRGRAVPEPRPARRW